MKLSGDTGLKQIRSFGLMVGGIFAVIGLWPMLLRGEDVRAWFLCLAGFLIICALVWPKGLKPVYKVWMLIGHALGWLNSRILLAVGFYGFFTPIGLVMRVMGKDPMKRKLDSGARSYRVTRLPRPGSHMKNQY